MVFSGFYRNLQGVSSCHARQFEKELSLKLADITVVDG